MKNWIKKTIHWFPRIFILIFAILIFIFALFSGAEQLGGGIKGVLLNSPNTIPWIILLGIVWLAWKRPKIGGYILIIISILFTIFFDIPRELIAILYITLPLLIPGIIFVIDSKINKKK